MFDPFQKRILRRVWTAWLPVSCSSVMWLSCFPMSFVFHVERCNVWTCSTATQVKLRRDKETEMRLILMSARVLVSRGRYRNPNSVSPLWLTMFWRALTSIHQLLDNLDFLSSSKFCSSHYVCAFVLFFHFDFVLLVFAACGKPLQQTNSLQEVWTMMAEPMCEELYDVISQSESLSVSPSSFVMRMIVSATSVCYGLLWRY